MNFEDMHEYPGNSDYYPVPNERLEAWQELLQGLPLYKVAGICSGGEVGLFALLPQVRRELVLVDHSYKSLYFAMVKYLALEKYGAEETYTRLTRATGDEFKALAAEFDGVLPPATCEVWRKRRYDGNAYYDNRTGEEGSDAFSRRAHSVKHMWATLPKERLIKACTKLNKVTFVHGDLTDLATKGKFGLLYLSNALEHNSRTKHHPLLEQIDQLVKPGGHVLTAEAAGFYSNVPPKRGEWEVVNTVSVKDIRGTECRWKYVLYKTPDKAAA
jgi:SAM-dependent methyltransferase